ncbi:hypothetical protein BB560_000601 [Smittium megazygosporum]|uniref:ER membrane protein complex subunit 7 beta-sandwich domain-containing protein n=1 Tax=Smittium megazygosporum TaxID=133381 RepID=A0A2T9ZJW5_9FUNG|nr:hypothetical protein BB560_000601 [Smittium megazygosporum]
MMSFQLRAVLNHGESFSLLRKNGDLYINNLSVGRHVLEIEDVDYVFPKLVLDISKKGEKAVVSAWYFQTGYEVNTNDRSLPFPLSLSPLSKREFIKAREKFNILKMLKSPYMLMVGFSIVMMFILPKLQAAVKEEEELSKLEAQAKTKTGPNVVTTYAE